MKKTINISLANILFHVEEDAYGDLERYLQSLKAHFASTPQKDEIIADMEARIAERFSEVPNNIITKEHVDALIEAMGRVEDIEENSTTEKALPTYTARRLYRNPEDVKIAGVASGIAAFFDIDPTVVRILFLLSILFGGTGIFLYIVLWMVLPEAKSPTERLAMHGNPVTVASVSEFIEEKKNEVLKKGTLQKFFEGFGKVVASIARIVSVFAGIILTIIGSIAAFGLTLGFLIALFHHNSTLIDFPLREILSTPLLYGIAAAGYFAIFIPSILLILLGVSILRRRTFFTPRLVLPLIGIWIAALLAAGVLGFNAAAKYEAHPLNQDIVQNYGLQNFSKIEAGGPYTIKLEKSDVFSVTAEGKRPEIERLRLEVRDETLFVSQEKRDSHLCILCDNERAVLLIKTPNTSSIKLIGKTRLIGESLSNDVFGLELLNGTSATLTGSTTKATFLLSRGSFLDAFDFDAGTIMIEASDGSHARIHALSELNAKASNGSVIRYLGNPTIVEETRSGSRIRAEENFDFIE